MLGNASREHSGNASGVLAIMRTFGQCLGAALVAIALSAFAAQAIHISLWVAVFATALATAISFSRIPPVSN